MSNTSLHNISALHTKVGNSRTVGDHQGFVQDFVPIAGSGLAMNCTRGILQTFRGIRTVPQFTDVTVDFPNVTDGSTIYVFSNHKTNAIYYATNPLYGQSGGPTNPEDQLLYFVTASGGSITRIGMPKYVNCESLQLVGTGLLDGSGVIGSRTYFGKDKYLIGIEQVNTETPTGAGTIDAVVMKQVTGTATVVGNELSVGTTAPDKTSWAASKFHILTTPALVQHGDRIQIKVGGTAAGDGTAEFYAILGGSRLPE